MIRITYCIISCFLLCGCSFSPLYNDYSQQIQLNVKGPSDITYCIYKFRRAIEARSCKIRFVRDDPYTVNIMLSASFLPLIYDPSKSVTRSIGQLVAHIRILDNGKIIYDKSLESISSYNIDPQEEFASIKSKEATMERLLDNLADLIVLEINVATNRPPSYEH